MALVRENRWAGHPKLAAALKIAIYVTPLVLGAITALVVSRYLQRQNPTWPWVGVSAATLPVSLAVVVIGERLLRRLLPLALLLKLSLLFPDQVPNRLGTALRAASPKRLLARLEVEDEDEFPVAERVITLVAALNAHDRRTRGHSERVRALTMLIADEMEIVGEDRDKLEWAALLHDLGKLEVPPEILNKKGRPSDDEWQILRGHPGAGPAHAAGLADWLGDWIHAMDQHHERFDGSGYPLGLSSEEIALSGRVVAVSDAFEVMTATRSYKKPMSTEAARSELVKCSGTHFDPVVVRSFMAVSIGSVHRALGPSSWIASLPFSGVTTPIASIGNSVVGGSVPPALAAAAALAVFSPATSLPSPAESVGGSTASTPVSIIRVDEDQGEDTRSAQSSALVSGVTFSTSADALFGDRPSVSDQIGGQEEVEDAGGDSGGSDSGGDPDPAPVDPPEVDDVDDIVDEVVTVTEPVGEVVEVVADTVDDLVDDLAPILDPVLEVPETLADVVDEVIDETPVETGDLIEDVASGTGDLIDETVSDPVGSTTEDLSETIAGLPSLFG